ARAGRRRRAGGGSEAFSWGKIGRLFLRDGFGGHERDEPADDALVLVEVAVGDALHVRGGDRAVGVLECVVERPVAGGDALVDAAGDGEGAVARVGDVGELLVNRGGDLGGG